MHYDLVNKGELSSTESNRGGTLGLDLNESLVERER